MQSKLLHVESAERCHMQVILPLLGCCYIHMGFDNGKIKTIPFVIQLD
jgi:hypothetical protein